VDTDRRETHENFDVPGALGMQRGVPTLRFLEIRKVGNVQRLLGAQQLLIALVEVRAKLGGLLVCAPRDGLFTDERITEPRCRELGVEACRLQQGINRVQNGVPEVCHRSSIFRQRLGAPGRGRRHIQEPDHAPLLPIGRARVDQVRSRATRIDRPLLRRVPRPRRATRYNQDGRRERHP
jgi:hypothetical protein